MLKITNLTKKYKKFLALENINFEIKAGEIVGLVGDNGAGKTTLINCILGNLKKNSGTIWLNNLVIENNQKDCRNILFMPDLLAMKINLTVVEYISYLALLKQENKIEVLKQLDVVLTTLDFDNDLKTKKIDQLSAGQKKKAFCAALLCLRVDLLILDEPTANLDVQSKIALIEILLLLNQQGVTILITSHIIEELQQIINHLIIINHKTIVYDQKFDKTRESIKSIYDQVVNRKNSNWSNLQKLINAK